jgi:hypothetical protein
VIGAVGVVVAISAIVGASSKDDTPSKLMTPVEAACSMLKDGDTPEEAYDAMKIVLDDHDYAFPDTDEAARLSVDQAVADGC